MTDFSKGGRGKKAPWDTVMYRIPLPIKPAVELFARAYRLVSDNGASDSAAEDLIKRAIDAIDGLSNHDTVSGHEQEIKDLKRDLEETQLELQKTRSLLDVSRKKEQDVTDQLCSCHSDAFKAADILKAALKLKAGNGGAIKVQIKEALKLIDDV